MQLGGLPYLSENIFNFSERSQCLPYRLLTFSANLSLTNNAKVVGGVKCIGQTIKKSAEILFA